MVFRFRLALTPLRLLVIASILVVFEPTYHVWSDHGLSRPSRRLDPPAHDTCLDPVFEAATTPRQNAALFMLARNSEVDEAIHAVRSLETSFNQHFDYPWVFLNDVEWSSEFKTRVRAASTASNITFATIPSSMWGWPPSLTEAS